MESLFALGYPGLFIASFLAATVIPFSSEAVLAAMIYGTYHPFACLVIASMGNWLGGLSSFGLGWLGRSDKVEKWLRIKPENLQKIDPYVRRWGIWLALFCWLPFVGDLFAVALGFSRTNIILTSVLMFVGKAIRYAVIIYFILLVV